MIVKLDRSLLEKSAKRFGIHQQITAVRVMAEFEKLLMQFLKKKTNHQVKPLYLKNQVLHISVTSSVLASEIRLYQKPIIAKINQKFKKTVIKNLRFLT